MAEDYNKLIGTRVKMLRITKGISQTELAKQIGVTQTHLSNIENGKNYPNSETIEKIAKGLGVEVFELFVVEHLAEIDNEKLLKELNSILKNDSKLLKTVYKIALNLKQTT